MSLQHHDNGKQGEFFLLDEQGKKIAKLTYFYETPDTINANHTFVDDSLRGQGVADKLYQALIHFIQAKKLTLHPTWVLYCKKMGTNLIFSITSLILLISMSFLRIFFRLRGILSPIYF